MRINAKVSDLVYGKGKVTNIQDNIIEVYFKKHQEVKYYENVDTQLYLVLENGLAKNPTASFSNKVGLQEEGIFLTGRGKGTRGVSLKRVNTDSRSYKIAHTLMNKDLTKIEIFNTMGVDTTGKKLGGYLSNIFSALSDAEVIQYDRKTKLWSKGPKFDYFLFVVAKR